MKILLGVQLLEELCLFFTAEEVDAIFGHEKKRVKQIAVEEPHLQGLRFRIIIRLFAYHETQSIQPSQSLIFTAVLKIIELSTTLTDKSLPRVHRFWLHAQWSTACQPWEP